MSSIKNLYAKGLDDERIAKSLNLRVETIVAWRKRYNLPPGDIHSKELSSSEHPPKPSKVPADTERERLGPSGREPFRWKRNEEGESLTLEASKELLLELFKISATANLSHRYDWILSRLTKQVFEDHQPIYETQEVTLFSLRQFCEQDAKNTL